MIARKSALIFLNTVVGGLLGLVALKATATFMNPLIVAQMAYPLGLIGLLFFMTDLGLGTAHVKRVSEGMDEGDCFVTFAAFKAVATLVFVTAALTLFYVRVVVMGVGFEDIALTAYLLLVGYYTAQALRSAFVSTFDAQRESARAQLVQLVETLVRVGFTLLVTAVYGALALGRGPLAGHVSAETWAFRLIAHYPAGALAFTFLAGSAFSLGVAYWQWRARGSPWGRFRWSILRSYWTFALPMFLLQVISAVSGNIDRAALGYFGHGVDAGIFELPKRFTTVLEAIPYAIAALLFPTISELHARNEREAVRAKTELALRYVSMLLMPIAAFVILFSAPLISIFISNQWLPAATAMSLLVAYTFLLGLLRPFYALVGGMNRSGIVATVGLVMAVSNIVLNVLLIPKDIRSLGITLAGLGVTGAALATLISGALGFVTMWYFTRKLDMPVGLPGFWRHAVGTTVMGLALFGLHAGALHPLVRWYDFIVYVLVGGVVYFLTLVALREFTRKDLQFFLGVASVREMGRYVRSEFKRQRRP